MVDNNMKDITGKCQEITREILGRPIRMAKGVINYSRTFIEVEMNEGEDAFIREPVTLNGEDLFPLKTIHNRVRFEVMSSAITGQKEA